MFGDYNPAGRLPVTFYTSIDQLPDFEDYNMTGRTYRYMSEQPLFPFGYGLSYTTFDYDQPVLSKNIIKAGQPLRLTVPVSNTGDRAGDEVVQVYLRKNNDIDGPVKTLRAFRRVHIPAGETTQIDFDLKEKDLEWWDEASNIMRVTPGDYEVLVGSNSADAALQILPFTIL